VHAVFLVPRLTGLEKEGLYVPCGSLPRLVGDPWESLTSVPLQGVPERRLSLRTPHMTRISTPALSSNRCSSPEVPLVVYQIYKLARMLPYEASKNSIVTAHKSTELTRAFSQLL
jgi:hypothetical protein